MAFIFLRKLTVPTQETMSMHDAHCDVLKGLPNYKKIYDLNYPYWYLAIQIILGF